MNEDAKPAAVTAEPTLVHRLEYLLVVALIAFLRLFGVGAASAIGGGFLSVVGPLVRPISRRGEANLRMIFPDWDEKRVTRTIRGVWANLGRTGAEFAHLDAFGVGGPDARIEVRGRERLARVAASGKSAIFVSGHFANWETMTIALRAAGVPHALVYRTANNPLVDGLIRRLRTRTMTPHQIPKGARGARALVETLRARRSIAMLVDQKLTDGVVAPFLGRDAPTGAAAARLSLKYGAPIYYGTLERLGGARMRLTIHPPIDYKPTGDHDTDVLALTTLLNAALEEDIRARPEQWLWLHRRWGKVLPAPVSGATPLAEAPVSSAAPLAEAIVAPAAASDATA